jgi:hypothetical protein
MYGVIGLLNLAVIPVDFEFIVMPWCGALLGSKDGIPFSPYMADKVPYAFIR